MFVLLLYDSNEWKFLFNLSIDFSIHMKKLMRLFTISERFLEKLFNFFTDSFKLLAFINLGHLFWEDMNSWFFKYRGRCLNLMSINFVFLWKSVDKKLISLAFHMKILVYFISGKWFRLNHFSVGKSVKYSISVENIFLYHRMRVKIRRSFLKFFIYICHN